MNMIRAREILMRNNGKEAADDVKLEY